MIFKRKDNEKIYTFVSVQDKETIILKGPIDNEFSSKISNLTEKYFVILEKGESWPEDLKSSMFKSENIIDENIDMEHGEAL